MPHELWLNSRRIPGEAPAASVTNPSTGEKLAQVHQASQSQILSAIDAMATAFPAMRARSSYQRFLSCQHVYQSLLARGEEFARTIALEAGKPIKTARAEVARAQTTFRLAMEEATRITGQELPVDIDARSQGYTAVVHRVAAGPCAFLTPFNFPLNLVAHKVAPALAAGCPFVVRPSIRTPLTALLLGDVLAGADLPEGSWHILPSDHEAGDPLVTDDRIRVLSFTGSPDVGWKLKSRAGKKTVVLELGNSSPVIVEPDVDLADAAARIVTGAFGYAGQSCISVQRIYLHEAIADEMTAMLVQKARAQKVGDPLDESIDVGPLIDELAAQRLENWIGEAVSSGARVLCGGGRAHVSAELKGAFLEPTLLENVDVKQKISCEEAFGPIAVIYRYADFSQALKQANATRWGLQAGIFTRDLAKARLAFETLDMGGVVINDVPTTRIDAMPYGGVKDSGLGREGVRYAIEHMTEYKVMLTRVMN